PHEADELPFRAGRPAGDAGPGRDGSNPTDRRPAYDDPSSAAAPAVRRERRFGAGSAGASAAPAADGSAAGSTAVGSASPDPAVPARVAAAGRGAGGAFGSAPASGWAT